MSKCHFVGNHMSQLICGLIYGMQIRSYAINCSVMQLYVRFTTQTFKPNQTLPLKNLGDLSTSCVRPSTLSSGLADSFLKRTKQEMFHNVTNAPKDIISRIEARGQGHSDPKTVRNTPRPQGVSTHQIWDL